MRHHLNVLDKHDYKNPDTRPLIYKDIVPDFHFDIAGDHLRHNREKFQKAMPDDTVYIATLREPYSHFKSVVNFFGVSENQEQIVGSLQLRIFKI